MTFLLLAVSIPLHAQMAFVDDTTAARLHIKTVIQKTYFGESKTPSVTYEEHYAVNGKLTGRITANNNFGTVEIREFFYYNQQGRLSAKRVTNYGEHDSTTGTEIYSYNAQGQLDSSFGRKIMYNYDGQGRVIEKIETTPKPVRIKTVYAYEATGRLRSEVVYAYNSKQQETVFLYNDNGRKSKEISSYYDFGEIIINAQFENTFRYDNRGLLTTEFQKQTIVQKGDTPDNRVYTFEYAFY